ncbi:inter-alpha-trypsin inhibitor heavy chain H5 isoform X1 [Danio rerio]|uniref:Inter-alpha-trypsin inhibitor heavy chain H5 isoform X1 n=1 Tax=Danio rerio TaxID=7955 RepID=A0A8M1PU27_DANRE|nr:inter-alpha-trypsin inhibitor heavy chain H5 isoform X1 [Danio rerio]|eukprot:XP_001331201.3 inter-alpha-trypsin inhibitor heavy chain H5 isoform X1 [Danio rerio]
MKMLLITLILYFCPIFQCQSEDTEFLEDGDFEDYMISDMDSNAAPVRIPRQVKMMLTKETKPHIQELSIQTTIISSYAFTAVSCSMLNRHSAAARGVFQFHIPTAAYISNFTMIVGGRVFPSQVKAKEKKVKKEGGENNGKKKDTPEQSEGELEVFRMEVTIPGRNRAVFLLTYEELLQRRLGRYEHMTSIRPMQLVSRLSVGVTIVEHSRISYLEVLPLQNGKKTSSNGNGKADAGPPVSTIVKQNETFCKISFTPNIAQQAKIATNGMLGEFVVHYDVERETGIGDIQVQDGHFVHYFAPRDLPVVPKNVVFVIDTSASMLGTKMKQTKQALFTIINELRPNDNFNFVTFSNRIRVWQPGKLVPVTPISIRDAKKFIYMISVTGGTDINGGIQTGSALLSDYLSSKDESHHHSVSLIIFLTDGRPTVGVLQSPTIISNTKTAVQEKFCLFTIGMGDDVDYRLLERMSLDNCGTMRRIPEDADASLMLKGFYDEIGTPLLSDIRVEYSEDAVEYITQNLFTNYFNGSELIVAGKLTNRSDSLHVQVTASNSDRSIIMEKDVSIQEREQETERRLAEAEAGSKSDGYVERLWGFLSVKDGLKGRLRSQTSGERENYTQHATNLSLTYNFLTPLTQMIVEKPEVLADGSLAKAPPKSTEAPPSAETANQLSEDDNSLPPQSLQRKQPPKPISAATKATGGIRKLAQKSVTLSKTSADGDPHFVVEIPQSKLTVCFNINGEPGQILRLVTDHKHSGVTVNGALIGAPAPAGSHKQQRTYFSTITIVADKPKRSYIEVTTQKVILDGRDRMILPTSSSISIETANLAVVLIANTNLTVTIQGSIQFVILFHHYKNPAAFQRDHLGFYIAKSKGLSKDTHGLLGQFLYEDIGLTQIPGNFSTTGANGTQETLGKNFTLPSFHFLKVKDRSVAVMKKSRRIYSGKQTVDCWFAKNNAAKLIDGQHDDYIVSHLFDTGAWANETNTH